MEHQLTNEEKEALLAEPDPTYATELRNLIYLHFRLRHDVRCANLMELTWSQIDTSRGIVMLEDSHGEKRTLALSESLSTLLKDWKKRQSREQQKRSQRSDIQAELVFTGLDGSSLDEEYLSKMVKTTAESAGIKEKVQAIIIHKDS
jgi:site-specific recombinase XerD